MIVYLKNCIRNHLNDAANDARARVWNSIKNYWSAVAVGGNAEKKSSSDFYFLLLLSIHSFVKIKIQINIKKWNQQDFVSILVLVPMVDTREECALYFVQYAVCSVHTSWTKKKKAREGTEIILKWEKRKINELNRCNACYALPNRYTNSSLCKEEHKHTSKTIKLKSRRELVKLKKTRQKSQTHYEQNTAQTHIQPAKWQKEQRKIQFWYWTRRKEKGKEKRNANLFKLVKV